MTIIEHQMEHYLLFTNPGCPAGSAIWEPYILGHVNKLFMNLSFPPMGALNEKNMEGTWQYS